MVVFIRPQTLPEALFVDSINPARIYFRASNVPTAINWIFLFVREFVFVLFVLNHFAVLLFLSFSEQTKKEFNILGNESVHFLCGLWRKRWQLSETQNYNVIF